MSNVVTLISALKERDIRVSLNGDKLKVSAPAGALTDEIKQQLQIHKEDLLDFLRHAQSDSGRTAITIADRNAALPLSYAQQRLWILDKIQPNLAAYNMPMAFRIRGSLDIKAMQRTLARITERHEVLRTSIYEHNGTPMQRINPLAEEVLRVIDAPVSDPAQRDAVAERLATTDAQTPFTLLESPLFRTSLTRLGDDDYVLLANMHHAVSDGWSVDVLFREIGAIYANEAMGLPAQLQPLTVQYADFAVWQRQWLDSDAHVKQLEYWKQQFKGVPSLLKLPTDRPRPPQQTFNGDDFRFDFGTELSADIRQFCQQHNVTLFSLLLAAYQLVLSRYAHQDDVCVAIPSAGRNRRELEGLIGFFVNVLIMRTKIAGNPSVLELVRAVKATALAGFANEDMPMEKIIEAINVDWNPAYPPLAQVGFALQNISSANIGGASQPAATQLGSINIESIGATRKSAKYDMIFFVTEGDDLSGSIEYNTDLFDRATMQRLSGHVKHVLAQMVLNPDRHLASIALAGDDELMSLLQLPADTTELILPLTATHEDLYLAHVVNPDTLINSLGQTVELHGDVDAEAVRAAVQRMVDHYAVLRASIVASPRPWTDVAYWVVERQRSVDFRVLDWSQEALTDDAMRARLMARIYQPYDIHGALYHFELIRVAPQRCIFALIANHIVFDGVAMRSFNQQLVAMLSNRSAVLPPDTLQDYIPQALNSFDTDANLAFWRTQLSRCEPLDIAIPASSGSKTLQTSRLGLRGDALTGIERFCAASDVSLPRLFKALYGVLINAYARADGDFQIRDTLAGRSERFREAIGCFHQIVPFVFPQTLLQPQTRIVDLLEHTRAFPRSVREHAQISLMQQRRLSDTGRCGFMYNFYTFEAPLDFNGSAAAVTTHPPLEVEGQVQLIVKPIGSEVQFDFYYYDHLFPNLRFLERLAHLAQQVANGAQTLGELSLVLPDEQHTLAQWNPLGQVFEQFAVHTRFEQMAARFGDRIALTCDGAQYTYHALNERANQIAHALIAQGVQAGDFVGLSMERSLDLMAGILGILKANAAYVPLDPHFPPERLAFILEDSKARVLLTHDAAGDGLDNFSGKTISLDRDRALIESRPTTDPACYATPASTIYVLYTSGTTGRPKGCVVTHGNVARLMTATDDDFQFNEHDVWTLFHSYAFDFTVWEMWGALLYGGKLVIVPYLLARSPHEFYDLLLQHKVTVLNQTPSAFSQLIAVDAARTDVPALALRYVVFGGEALDFNALRTWVGRHGLQAPKLVNMYGITETTVHVTRHTLTEHDFEQPGSIVGRPIKDLHVHIVDRYGKPTPIGLPGEMRIAGPGVTEGYLQRDDLTAERFTPNTFVESLPTEQRALYARLYHSGDLARFTPDGNIEYLGRIDLQVKIRGHRIELGEIMAQLAALDEVREAVVIVREDNPDDQRLVAYLLLPEGKQDLDINQVRSQLKLTLPEYMVPAHFIVLDAWPLTPTGKVDKKALPAPEGDSALSSTYVAPRNATEQRLCTLWADMLGVTQVGIHDNFFELGGHSLLATRIVGRVREEFQCDINLRALFEQPTVAALAAQIDGGAAPSGIARPPLAVVSRDERIPVSYAQQRLWIIDQLQPGSPVYNMPTALRLSGELDVNALERTLATLVERHESLRTTFDVANGEPYQVIHPVPHEGAAFSLPRFDINDDELQLQARAAAFAMAPFDLKHGPLFKAELWQLTNYAGNDKRYVLAVNMHHIISDGLSVQVLLQEVIALYAAFTRGADNPLPALRFQYADFSVWQRQWLQGEALDTQISYWKQQLLGVPMLELPTDFARSSTQNAAGKQLTFGFSETLSQQLRELAQHNGATLYQTLLAAFQLLLSRLSRQDDIAVGSPIANRTQPELEPIIGFFVNTLVMRSQIDADATFTDFLAAVKKTTLDAYQHQDVSFEKLVDALNMPRELSHTPLFQVMFVLQSAAQLQNAPAINIGNLDIAPLFDRQDEADCAAKFDITLALADTGAAIGGMIEYRTALFASHSMRALIAHFEALLTDIARRPHARLRDYGILTPAETERQLLGFNAAVSSTLPVPALTPIHTRFEQMAARFGDRTAITLTTDRGAESISYTELNARANQIAHALIAQGVATGDYVGLCLERSIGLISAMLGILKAGAAYVPLDAHFPAERLQYILEDSQARVLVTESALIDVLPTFNGSRIVVDTDAAQLALQPAGNTDVSVTLDSTIYIIYTSGTTGKPKGCLLNHGNVARLFTATNDEFRFNEHDVWTLFHSFAFDFSVWEIWGALLFGGRLVIVPYAISRAPDEFYRLLVNEGVTVLNQTPSAFSQLVAIDAAQAQPSPHKLRCVVFGGEALDFNALRPWVKRYGLEAPTLINMYGITETTVHVTYYPLTQKDFDQGGSIIGTPIRDLHVHLLDAHGQLAPVGVPGEIHVSGPGVSDGYLKRPDLTAERFIDNPFAHLLPASVRAQHTRLYKSGDLARYLDNGDIEYLGRIDLQVKIRGHRIELGEIMAQLAALDEVREAVVIVNEGIAGDQRLIAYLLKPADRDDIDPGRVRAQLKAMLPDYMIPSTFVVMEAWPLTPNGKIDKKALPAPDQGAQSFSEYIAPRNDIEAQIAGIWQNLLGIDHVSVNANFFEMGGHSLLATQVMSRLREHFGVDIPLRTLFEQPSIEQLAVAIANSTSQSLLPPIDVTDHTQPLPLSFNQQRLWIVQQMEPSSSAYNMPVALRVRGALDAAALEQAFRQLIARHAVLRTRFISIDDQPRQIIDASIDWRLARETVNASDETAKTVIIRQLAAQQAAQPFNLETGPVIRATLFQLDSNDHVLVLVMHHIASDGWSMQLMVREVAALYANATLSAGLPLPRLPVQYADFAAWQHEHLQGDKLHEQLQWWREQLADAPRVLNLPTDRPRPPVQTDRGAVFAMQLPSQLSQQVHAFATQHQMTPFMVMLSAYQLLLAKYAGQNDICVGIPIAGRHQRETENLIGFFVNALIVRTHMQDNPSVRTLLARVKDTVLGAFAHQDVPIESVIEHLNVPRSLAYSPIAQVGFNYLPAAPNQTALQLGDLSFEAVDSGFVAAKYDMIWSFQGDADNIGGGIEYRTDLFDANTIAAMFEHYLQLLSTLLEAPDCGVDVLQWLPPAALYAALGIDADNYERVNIATAMQRDLYLDTVLHPENRRDYLGHYVDLRLPIDVDIWQQAGAWVHAACSGLRTHLISAPRPWLAPAYAAVARVQVMPPPFRFVDLAAEGLSYEQLLLQLKEETYRPYAFDGSALYRHVLCRITQEHFVVLFVAHHALLDGIGGAVCTQMIIDAYESLLRGDTPQFPPDVFGDYYAHNHQNVDTEQAIAYWREAMTGVEPLTAYVEPANAGRDGNYHQRELRIDREHWAAIGKYCRAHRTTPALYLKAVYSLLLASICNARGDFYFNEITLGRPKGHTTTVGLYFEQMPQIIRLQAMTADSSMDDLLGYIGGQRKLARDGLQLSNARQQALLPQSRALVLFNFYPMPAQFTIQGQTVPSNPLIPQMDNCINFVAQVREGELELLLSYTDNIFADPQFLERLVHLSRQIVGGVSRLSDLTLTFAHEQPNLLDATHTPRYSVSSVQALFENQVAVTPDTVAIEQGNSATGSDHISYAALNRRANQLAHYLRQHHDIGRGDLVGCCFAPGIELMVAILGTIKAGAAYVPMDANYPVERLDYMLRDSNARVLLSESCLAERLPDTDCVSIMLDRDADAIAAMPQANPTNYTELDDLLYVIYTSGSTGRPKGAAVKHRGELNLLAWYVKEFRFSRNDHTLIISAIGFDLTQKNLLAPLVSGGRVVMPQGGYDDQAIRTLIEARQISVVNCAPSAFYPLVENADDVAVLNSLRLTLFGGEPIRIEKLLPWLTHTHCVAQVVNMYGPTECTDIATFYRITEPQRFINQPMPIGKANDNVQLYIVDASNRLVPPGVPGELLIGGEGVGAGYLGKPELTDKVFIANPFGEGTLYRTGDLVREVAGGNIEFISRIDFQVKLRGLRIELGEIEFALRQLADVTDALALVRNETLVAYVTAVPESIESLTLSPWRTQLARHLPDYMVPQALVALPRWPLTPNGKIDRAALPSPDTDRAASYVAPRNEIEAHIATIWSEILLVPQIGMEDDFFSLGGHSLLATRLVARMRAQLGVDVTLRDLFGAHTISAQAALVATKRATSTIAFDAIKPADRSQPLPLSFSQEQVWLLDQMQPGLAAYNIPLAARVRGTLNVDAMQRSLVLLLTRHEVLRSVIAVDEDHHPYTVINDVPDLPITLSEEHIAEEQRAARARQLAAEEAGTGFDLAQGPLMRVRLIRFDATDHLLLVTQHHIVSDGWSMEILLRELGQTYIALTHGMQPQLPALPIQYVDYAVWQRQWLREQGQQQLQFWVDTLKGAPPLLKLPTDRPRPLRQTFNGTYHQFSLDAALTTQIKSLADRHNATLFMTLMAAWQLLLAKYAGQKDVVVGLPNAGRGQLETESLIGFFVNPMVLRADLSDNCTIAELIERVRNNSLDAFAHANVPAEMIIDALKIQRNPAYPPLAQVGFAMQNLPTGDRSAAQAVGDISIEPIVGGNALAKYDITLFAQEHNGKIEAAFEYNTDLFDASTLQRMGTHLQRLLQAMATQPEQAIDTISLYSSDELIAGMHLPAAQVQEVLPLPHTMRDFYLASVMAPETVANSIGCYFHIHDEVDPDAWRAELQAVVDHYRLMRGRVVGCDLRAADIAYLVVSKQQPVAFTFTDWSGQSADALQVHRYLEQRCYKPYDVTRDALVGFELVRLNQRHHIAFCFSHHMILDGAGMSAVVRQASARYFARRRGEEIRLEADNFVDFIELSRQQYDTAATQRFWREQLHSTEALQAQTQLAHRRDSRFIADSIALPADLDKTLKRYCREHRITPALYYKVLFGLMIGYYCRAESDFVIRDTLLGRNKEHESSVGCFTESPPFVFPQHLIGKDTDIDALYVAAKEFTRASRDFGRLSILAQRQLLPATPLNFLYNFLTYDVRIPVADGYSPAVPLIPNEIEAHVQFIVFSGGASTELHLRYRDDTFVDLNLLQRAIHVTRQLVGGTAQYRDLQFCLPDEVHELMSCAAGTRNGTAVDYQPPQVLHLLFEQAAQQHAQSIAVSDEHGQLTYAELNAGANRLAHYLRELGVGADSMVGVYMERATSMSVALLAIHKAGGAYVPFDPSFPAERLQYMAQDASVSVLLTQQHLVANEPTGCRHVLCVDDAAATWRDRASDNLSVLQQGRHLFNVIYTSGSTGMPKGVMVLQEGVINRILWMQQEYRMTPADVVLQKTPYSFDVSVWELFWPLLLGARLHYARPDGHKDPDYLRDLIVRENVTTLHFVPSMLGIFLQTAGVEACRSMRLVFCSGEALQLEHERRFFERLAFAELHNLYGPTEASIDVSYFQCLPNSSYPSVPIGKPVANTQLHVLDPELRPVPPGLAGELYLGGIQLARGYLNRAELTATTFIDNPYAAAGHPSPRLYKTGDLTRYMVDGNVEYIGRVDFQVKVRGLRIELGEIETQLHRHPDVKECLVTIYEKAPGDVILVGYVVAQHAEAPADTATLKEYLRQTLPEYMVPNAFIGIDAIPLSPNGKANRKALPAPVFDGQAGASYVAPRTDLELILSQIWQEVLGVPQVGIRDNFFELGGHSLLAVRMMARVREELAVELPLRELFQAPSVETLAGVILGYQINPALTQPPIVAINRDELAPTAIPLSFAQHRLWLMDRIQPLGSMYNMPLAVRLSGKLDVDALERSFANVIARHEVLRTAVAVHDGEPYQLIHAKLDWQLEQMDFPAKGDDAALAQAAFEYLLQPFDLAQAPMLRARLLRLAPQEHVLLFCMHHIASDGASVNIMLRDVVMSYVAFSQGQTPVLPPLPIQYADYAIWQRNWLQGDVLDEKLAYWKQKLQAVSVLKLPTDRPRSDRIDTRGAQHRFFIDEELTTQLRGFAGQHNATLFMVMMSAFQVLLHRYSGQSDISVGTAVAGRSQQVQQDLIGFFVNTLVVRGDIRPQARFADVLAQIRQSVLEAFQHQEVPFEQLVEELKLPRSLQYSPLFQVALSYQAQDSAAMQALPPIFDAGDLTLSPLAMTGDAAVQQAKYDLMLSLSEMGGRIGAELEFRTALFDHATMERLGQHFVQTLRALVADASKPVRTLQLTPADDLPALLGLAPDSCQRVLPLTTTLRDLYLAHVIDPTTQVNSLGQFVVFDRAVNPSLLRDAAQQLVDHTDILRARFVECHDGFADEAYMVIDRQRAVDFRIRDLRDRTFDDAGLRELINGIIYVPYDIHSTRLCRFELLQLAANRSVLVLAANHILFDGTSSTSALKQLLKAYECLSAGTTPQFEPNLFADYIEQARTEFDSHDNLEFWRHKLASVQPLNFSKPPSAVVACGGGAGVGFASRHLTLDASHVARVEAYCKSNNLTLPRYFRSLYGVLIRNYCRTDADFQLRDTLAGRPAGHRETLGCYHRMVPFVFPQQLFATSTTLPAFFAYTEQYVSEVRALSQISLVEQRRLCESGNIGFIFNFYRFDYAVPFLDAPVALEFLGPIAVDGQVQLLLEQTGDTLRMHLHFPVAGFDDLQLLMRLAHLSEQVLNGAGTLGDFDLLLPAEKAHLLGTAPGQWHHTQHDLPPVRSVQKLIEQQVVRSPQAIAVRCGDNNLTYQQLNQRANQLAHRLRSLGVKPGVTVGVCLGRRSEVLVAILAVMKAGGIYIPMDASYPEERLRYMLDDARAPLLVSEDCVAARLTLPASTRLVSVDDASLGGERSDNPPNLNQPEHGLYIIYTSGSTGLPKGALVFHRGEINLLQWYSREFAMTERDSTLIMSAFGFDLTQKNFFSLLTVGGTVVLPADDLYDVAHFLDTIERHQVTMLNCAPSAFYPLIEGTGNRDRAVRILNRLRLVFFGGEPISLKQMAGWIENPGFTAEIVNMYGPTECTDIATTYRLRDAARALREGDLEIPLGVANDNVLLYVMNQDGHLLPPGLAGELYIGGAGVGGGYLNRAELTAEKFVANPYGDGGLYRTGDLVRFTDSEARELAYIGRIDFQVKLRGLRIELGEIEHALRNLDGVSDSLVMVEQESLLAYVIHSDGTVPPAWREELARHLPTYMVPNALLALRQWPLTPNGKVDRKALPKPQDNSAADMVAPRTDTEATLAAIFAEALGLPGISIHANFFELGGHSLTAIKLIHKIERHFDVKLPLSSLFAAQTVAQMAFLVQGQLHEWSPIVPIQAKGDRPALFAVHPGGGMVLCYQPLSKALGEHQPFYALQAHGFENDQTPFTDLPAMAASYIDAMRQVQPQGPYHLLGHSFGGAVAYEMARQLIAQKQTVAVLIMLDSYVPTITRMLSDAELLAIFVNDNFGPLQLPMKQLKQLPTDKLIDLVVSQSGHTVNAQFVRNALATLRGFNQMQIGYKPLALQANTVLVRPADVLANWRSRVARVLAPARAINNGWNKLIEGGPRIEVTAGDHNSMLREPNVVELAKILQPLLDARGPSRE